MIINTRKMKNIAASKGRRRISPDMDLEKYLAYRYPNVSVDGKLGGLRKSREKRMLSKSHGKQPR